MESLSVGYLLIAFAVSVLLAWQFADWWLVIPFFLIAAGIFYAVVGIVRRPAEEHRRRAMRDSPYYVFWGGTISLIGMIWLVNRQFPGNVPLLFVIFVLWIGAVALMLSLPRLRGNVPTQ